MRTLQSADPALLLGVLEQSIGILFWREAVFVAGAIDLSAPFGRRILLDYAALVTPVFAKEFAHGVALTSHLANLRL
jgi:hypothetical protein